MDYVYEILCGDYENAILEIEKSLAIGIEVRLDACWSIHYFDREYYNQQIADYENYSTVEIWDDIMQFCAIRVPCLDGNAKKAIQKAIEMWKLL